MKSHPLHWSVHLLFFLVIAAFLAGTLHSFIPVRAGSALAPTPAPTPSPGEELFPAEEEEEESAPSPTPVSIPADTNGVNALGILLVIVILVGALIGERNLLRRKTKHKK